jgi:hypothetical protein
MELPGATRRMTYHLPQLTQSVKKLFSDKIAKLATNKDARVLAVAGNPQKLNPTVPHGASKRTLLTLVLMLISLQLTPVSLLIFIKRPMTCM